MRIAQLRELTREELMQRLRETTEALLNLRVQLATSELEDNKAIWRTRREIAQIKTLLREHQVEEQES